MIHSIDPNDELSSLAQPLLRNGEPGTANLQPNADGVVFHQHRIYRTDQTPATSGPRAKVRILVRDHRAMVKNDHPFIKWAQRFTSYISWRVLPGHFQAGADVIIIGDRTVHRRADLRQFYRCSG